MERFMAAKFTRLTQKTSILWQQVAERVTLPATVSVSGDFQKSEYTFVYTYTHSVSSYLGTKIWGKVA